MASALTASRLRASRVSRLTLRLLHTLNSQGNPAQQGFSLVEMMVVIVIIGILSAVALPQFLGVKDKAKLNTQISEAGSLAKECAAALISDGPYPAAYTLASGKTVTGTAISGNCSGTTTADPPTTNITFTTSAATASGSRCGNTSIAVGKTCVVTVTVPTGAVTYTIP